MNKRMRIVLSLLSIVALLFITTLNIEPTSNDILTSNTENYEHTYSSVLDGNDIFQDYQGVYNWTLGSGLPTPFSTDLSTFDVVERINYAGHNRCLHLLENSATTTSIKFNPSATSQYYEFYVMSNTASKYVYVTLFQSLHADSMRVNFETNGTLVFGGNEATYNWTSNRAYNVGAWQKITMYYSRLGTCWMKCNDSFVLYFTETSSHTPNYFVIGEATSGSNIYFDSLGNGQLSPAYIIGSNIEHTTNSLSITYSFTNTTYNYFTTKLNFSINATFYHVNGISSNISFTLTNPILLYIQHNDSSNPFEVYVNVTLKHYYLI